MSATARNPMPNPLDETIIYVPGPERRPEGSPTMPNATDRPAPHRYVYGSGSRPLDGYTIKRAIGRGGFGEVYYATSDSGKEVALKLITRNVEVERRGVAQCMNLKCPNLLSIFDIRSNDAGETFVIMEYVSGSSLATVLESNPAGMPINEVRAWLRGLVDGVDYLHDHGIVHRDLKPANLFMEEGVVKIGDYGLAKIISGSQGSNHSESIGTCHYMAPEIATGKYQKPIDIYAIGVVLFEMLTGRVPFEGESVAEILCKHMTSRPDLSRLAEPYKTIVGEAMAKDPANRPKRAHDLLGPDESPRPRDVRFIGEGKTVPTTEAAPPVEKGIGWPWGKKKEKPAEVTPAAFRPEEDDVLRIGEVDPVFYIGPETKPPRPASPPPRPRRGFPPIPPIRWVGGPARPAAPPRPVARRPAPAPVPTPPPVEPARPTRRARVGELAGAMVSSALLVGLFAWPVAAALDLDPLGHPERAAFLFGMALAASWAALVPAKILEGSKADGSTRRLVNLAAGAGVGLFGVWYADWLKLPLRLSPKGPEEIGRVLGLGPEGTTPTLAVAYFAAAFLAVGWWKLADRDRSSKVRAMPILVATAVAAGLTAIWPYRETWVAAVLPAVALATQVVSPWSREAAAYASYKRAVAKTVGRAA